MVLAATATIVACSGGSDRSDGEPDSSGALGDAGTRADGATETTPAEGHSGDDGGGPEAGGLDGGAAAEGAVHVDAGRGVDAAVPDRTSDSCRRIALTFGSQAYPTTVCLVALDGTLDCALNPADPSSGNTSPLLPSAPLSGVRCISGGEDFFCALTDEGGVTCWGDESSFDPAHIAGLPASNETLAIPGLQSGVVDVAAGETHVCVLMATGAVMCWGYPWGEDNNGQYVPGTWPLSASPTPVAGLGGPAVKIASGDGYSCALRDDGTVLCWGFDGGGELGDGVTSNSATPVVVALPSAAVGVWADQSEYPCALLTDGGVWCWNLITGGHPAPVTGFSASVTALTVGGEYGALCALLSTGGVQCWSAGAPSQQVDVLPAGSGVVELTSSDSDYCVLLADGGVTCLYDDDTSQLGLANSLSAPTSVPGL
jgi:hypothetical protein